MNEIMNDPFAKRDENEVLQEVVEEKLVDAQTPGFIVEFSPDEAELAGACAEDALSLEDALESTVDIPDATKE